MTKKILLIIGILVIIGVATYLILGGTTQKEGGSGGEFSFGDFLPFGKSDNISQNNTAEGSTQGSTLENITSQPIPRLRKISSEPVAGAIIFNTGTTSIVRFIEKGTGNVYETNSSTTAIQRLTNTTIPKIIRAYWLPNGSGFLAQTLLSENQIVETNFVKLNKNTSTSTEDLTPFNTTISKLPTDIKEISIKPDGSKILYYTVSGSQSNWYTSNPDGTSNALIFSHPLTEWLPKWVSSNFVILQTKNSSKTTGYVYSFDVQNKILKKIGDDFVGLSSNSNPDGSLILASSGQSTPQLFIFDNKDRGLDYIDLKTLAEKCVWAKSKNPFVYCAAPTQLPSGNFLDNWYKGLVSTEDFITKIDLSNNILYDTANVSEISGQKIDAVDLALSPDETHLIFRNKIDGYLWMLRIEE